MDSRSSALFFLLRKEMNFQDIIKCLQVKIVSWNIIRNFNYIFFIFKWNNRYFSNKTNAEDSGVLDSLMIILRELRLQRHFSSFYPQYWESHDNLSLCRFAALGLNAGFSFEYREDDIVRGAPNKREIFCEEAELPRIVLISQSSYKATIIMYYNRNRTVN